MEWIFHSALPEQDEALLALAEQLAPEFRTVIAQHDGPAGLILRARFDGDDLEAEDRGRAYWLALHSRCLDENLALELTALENLSPAPALAPLPAHPAPAAALSKHRPVIPIETVYDLLRADDPDLDRNLTETIGWIESAGLPVINLLSYLDLPLFQAYAAEHGDERDQNLFLHMLHTWTCYRHAGEIHTRLTPELAAAFTDPRYLRINTTQFRSPAPALCLQFPEWVWMIRPNRDGGKLQWAKEIYLTHMDPPTPADDRELTFLIAAYDEAGAFGFIPLEVPLSLPGVGQSIDAFFAPSEGDEELGANTEDLHRLVTVAATYCLYACARDPTHYLQAPA